MATSARDGWVVCCTGGITGVTGAGRRDALRLAELPPLYPSDYFCFVHLSLNLFFCMHIAGVDRRDALRLAELEAELSSLKGQRDELAARVDKEISEVGRADMLMSTRVAICGVVEAQE